MKTKDQTLLEEAYLKMKTSRERIERGEAEDELYDACVALCDVVLLDVNEEEMKLAKAQRTARFDAAYEKALSVLGNDWAESVVKRARRDCGEDE
jgi:hypothetical protein